MELLFTHCAGMDVHKDSVVVCVRVASGTGPASERVERFGTINSELQRLVGASKAPHLEEAIAAVEIKLSAEELAALAEPYRPHAVLGHG